MFGFSAERPALSWLLRHLGPPPPPRRHFSKSWDYVARHQAVRHPGTRHLGPEKHVFTNR